MSSVGTTVTGVVIWANSGEVQAPGHGVHHQEYYADDPISLLSITVVRSEIHGPDLNVQVHQYFC